MQLRRLLWVFVLVGVVPACSAIVSPDTTRLGGGPDSGQGVVDVGPQIDVGPRPDSGGGTCATGCDDSIPCTTDSCNAATSTCSHVPNDAVCGAGMRCSATLGCIVVAACTSDADCSDGNACNGVETCAPGTAGADPTTGCVHHDALDCNDHVDCTTDACDPASGCTHAGNDAACDDTFACTTDTCTATGCAYAANDAVCNAAGGCFTGATCQVGVGCTGGFPTTCMADGNPCTSDPTMCDPSTGMCLHPPRDDDHDGHAIHIATNTMGMTVVCAGDDCDDSRSSVHPGATELCNGIDDNCNGTIDEGCVPGMDDCSSEMQIPLMGIGGGARGGSVMGANDGYTDDYTSMCGHAGGLDAVYYVDIPGGLLSGAVDVTFTTESPSTDFDTVLAATVGNTCGATGFGTRLCNDDISSSDQRSRLTVCVNGALVSSGTRVHVLMDGFDGTSVGNYQLSVTVSAHPGGTCP